MRGTLYGVGVGSGDPELITLKAVRIIRQCDVVAVPQSRQQDVELVAYNIAKAAVPELEEKQLVAVYMPMVRDRAELNRCHDQGAQQLAQLLDQGKNVAFLTLGDPTVYSTYIYLHKRVRRLGYQAEIIPGVPSFCAVAARLGISLVEGSEPLHVIPGSYPGAEEQIAGGGTKVIMKTGKQLPRILQLLRESGQLQDAALVHKCGMEGEQVFTDMEQLDERAGYFSVLVVRPEEEQA
ncbi:MAG: precorrin-2 C(20)-methyltransferase [Eubacteriales bacterium]|jgi:precorrin-2/cobalt-factor-2 C20-methyltransferase